MKVSSNIINNVLDKIGTRISSPEQRAIQGVVALGIQPFIDFSNKGTDDETRAVSAARTTGKIIAGTLTGVGVRYASIKAIEKFSQFEINGIKTCISDNADTLIKKGLSENTEIKSISSLGNKWSIFTPKIENLVKNNSAKPLKVGELLRRYSNYTKTGGTILGVCAMVFTNFLVDVPITKYITQKLTPVFKSMLEKTTKNTCFFDNGQLVCKPRDSKFDTSSNGGMKNAKV